MKIDPVLDELFEEQIAEEIAAETPQLENINALLDRVFRDPSIKYGLKFFEKSERESLKLREDGKGIISIYCFARKKWFRAKPEEVVRQMFLVWIRDALGYDLARVGVTNGTYKLAKVPKKNALTSLFFPMTPAPILISLSS